MRKNLLPLFFGLFFISLKTYSQDDQLLKAFKFRTPRYQALVLDLGGGFSSDHSKMTITNGTYRNGGGSAGAGYTLYKSTDRQLFSFSANANAGYNGTYSRFNNQTNKGMGGSGSVQLNLNNQWFSGQRFMEAGLVLSGQLSGDKNTQTAAIITKAINRNNGYGVFLPLGIGKGRLENITDMQNAMWLAKALQQEGRLTRELSTEEWLQLGRSITRANNTRVLDSRKQRQFQLETVDNFLQEKGLINKNDIKYFSNLNDILFFAFNNFRLSGTEKFIRITPGISGRRLETKSNDTGPVQTDAVKSVTLSAGFNSFVPLRLTRQFNYGATAEAAYYRYDGKTSYYTSGSLNSTNKSNAEIRQAGLSAFLEQAFYPNTRTVVSVRLQARGGYQQAENENRTYGQISLTSGLNYFISYRTRFFVTAGLNYNKNMYNVSQQLYKLPENIRFNISAGLAITL